jgi:uncharacterized protein
MQFKDAKKILNKHKVDLNEFGVNKLAIFGSVAKNTAKSKSDIDILIDFDSKRGFFVFINLKNYLEELLKCDVDLVTKNALHPALKKKILNGARNVF